MKTNIRLIHNFGFKWYSNGSNHAKGYAWDNQGNFYKNAELLNYIDYPLNIEHVVKKVSSLNGCFSLIFKINDCIILVTDLTRSFPLFYYKTNESILVSDCAIYLAREVQAEINDVHLEEFLVAGYVFSDGTIFKGICSTTANTILILEDSKSHSLNILKLCASNKSEQDDVLLSLIDEHFSRLSKQLIESAEGRTIVVPLSGGLDSRAIVAMLFRYKYENVVCYTYGKKNSEEYRVSKFVAEKLRYRHIFIEYTDDIWSSVFTNKNSEFFEYAFNGVSAPHYQDIYAIEAIHTKNLIPRNSIIVPGHSGDLIGGSHLRTEFYSYIARDTNYLDPKNIIISKHIDSVYRYKDEIDYRIDLELKDVAGFHYFPTEYWNIVNRQAKYINNSVRIYEYYGYEYRLPLWDTQLTKFFLELPPCKRTKTILYEVYLHRVFKDLGIDEYIKNDRSYRDIVRPLIALLPKKIKSIIKDVYVGYILRKTDYNNFIAANNLLNCKALTFKELQKGYTSWLYEKFKANWRI